MTTSLGRVSQYTYNLLGIRTSRTDALGRVSSYSYDSWLRLTQITYPDSSVQTFSYDPNDNLVGWVDSIGSWARSYDASNRLTSESLNGVVQVSYSYDAPGKRGLLSSMSDLSGRTVSYSYTPRNELASVTEPWGTTSYSYDATGNEVSITYANGLSTSNSYDPANRLTSIEHRRSDNTVVASYSYSYNADGLRTQVVEADGSVVSYSYDGAHRLVGEVRTGTSPYSISCVLDGEGNRLSQTVNGVVTTFSYNADDQLLSTSGGLVNSYSYNGNGEQVSRVLNGVSYTLSWDYDGQLVGITGIGSAVTFGYDALGRRVSRSVNGVTTQMVHDGGKIALELQGNTVTAVYQYGNSLVSRNDDVVLGDGLGTVRQTVDSSQAVTSTFTTEAFGVAVSQWGSSSNPYRFAGLWGYRDDGDAGLLHVGARYYDPQVGRFISRDAVLSEHPYLYCEHEPVNAVDPSGEDWFDDLTNFFAGMGDAISFGLTDCVRNWLGTNDVVDHRSGWYKGGEVAGYAWWFAFNGVGYQTGWKFRFGRNWRIAPWGNRTGHRNGRYPHYHRRGQEVSVDIACGNQRLVISHGGIGWEVGYDGDADYRCG